jgi:hypothetical protein
MDYIMENKREIITEYLNNDMIKEAKENITPITKGEFTTTSGVGRRCLKLCENTFEYKPVKMKIIPILFRQLCFQNTMVMKDILEKRGVHHYEYVLGVNITACPCGCKFTLELHAVLYNTLTKSYEDYTTDYGRETNKWFIPVKHYDDKNQYWGAIKLCSMMEITYFWSWRGEHKCKNDDSITWISSVSTPQNTLRDYYNTLENALNVVTIRG